MKIKNILKKLCLFSALTVIVASALLSPYSVYLSGTASALSQTGTNSSSGAEPIPPTNVSTRSCPSGDSFTMGDKAHAPSCYKNNPTSQTDCPAGSKYHAASADSLGYKTPSSCVSPGDNPSSGNDCPVGSTFVKANVATGHNSCSFNPTSSDCSSGTHFVPGDSAAGKQNTCVSDVSSPRNQADCTPSGLIYQPAISNVGAAVPASCAKPTQAATTYCKNQTGSSLIACEAGYDTQDCSSFTGGILSECKTASTAATSTNNNQGSSNPTCDSSGISLSWIMCPIIDNLASAADSIYSKIIQPLLVTAPVSLSSSDKTFKVWSNFRLYGDVFLVIALLVVVFGESIGGGLIDAYSVKKILPRLLVAAVLINLSIYLVAIAVDVTNILGGGIAAIIETPFKNAGAYTIHLSGGAGDLGVAALVTGGIWAYISLAPLLMFLFMFFLIPAFLTLVAILVTVFLRQGIIILLVMISPVAFALYCLPNTEKYFKQWWDLLYRTLLVYPIIAVLFALANVLSVTISLSSKASGLATPLVQLMALIALFVPLFLIPYSFRLAGGVIGKFHELATTARKRGHEAYLGNEQDPWSRRNRAKYGMTDRNTRTRERIVNWGQEENASFGVGRRAIGRALNTGNLQAKRSRFNRERAEVIGAQYSTGDDSNLRDLFIAWDPAGNDGKGAWFRRMDMENGHAIPGAPAMYKDKAVGQMAHNKSLSLYKGDQSSIQEALFYEWKKTGFEPAQMSRIENQYPEILDDVGLNANEGTGVMKGVGFRHAPQSLVGKYSTFISKDNQWRWQRDYVGLSKEAAQNYDLYGLSKQDRTTFNAMGDGYEKMRDIRNNLPAEAYTDASRQQLRPDYILPDSAGPEFSGKTTGQIDIAMSRLERLADQVNVPEGGLSGPVLNVPDEEGGQPVFGGGMRGISNAPVDVQKAATEFYARVRGSGAGGPPSSGGGPRRPGGRPGGAPPQGPDGSNVSPGGVILPR